jgi:hypothetical protein
MATWIWLTDPKYTTNVENDLPNRRRKILRAGRILRELDSQLYAQIDLPNSGKYKDEDADKTPIQSWVNPNPIVSQTTNDLLVRSVVTNSLQAYDIDLILGVYIDKSLVNPFNVAFAGAATLGYCSSEYRANTNGASGWGAALRDMIVQYFNTPTNPLVVDKTAVPNVNFQYRSPATEWTQSFIHFLLDSKANVNTVLVNPGYPKPVSGSEFWQILATLNHS